MASTTRLDPEAIAGATFSAARRGYDPDEVRPFLRAVSEEMERLRRELDDVRAQLAHRTAPMVDESSVAAALGEEAVHLLTTAREGAAQIRSRAEDSVAELIRDANEDAARLRREADLDATHRRQLAAAEAEAAVEAAKSEGREMVAEARAVRERMLDDLSRRRERARSQFEQLRQSYERVLRTFESSAGALAVVTEDLRAIGPEVGANATTLESSGDTGPVALVEPLVAPVVEIVVPQRTTGIEDRIESDDAVVDVAFRADILTAADPTLDALDTDEADDAVTDAELDAAGAGSDDREPDVVVQAFVLGELDDSLLRPRPVADVADEPDGDAVAAAPGPEPEIVLDVTTVEVTVIEVVEPAPTDELLVESQAEPAPTERLDELVTAGADDGTVELDASTPHKPLPSAEDLFARIRAAREQLTAEAHEVIAGATAEPATTTAGPVVVAPASAPEPTPVAAATASAAAPAVTAADAVAARAEALAPIEEAMARRLKRVLADEQNEVLDRLRKAKTNPSLDELVGDPATHAAQYQRAVEGDAWAAVVVGARSLSGGDDQDDAIEGRTDLVAAVAAEVATELVDPFRERLAATLAAHEPAEAAEVLRAVYRDWKTQRIDAVSEHVSRFAYGRGAFAALVPGTAVCWAVDPTGPGCPDGEDNMLGGPVPAGEAFPTGHICAPAYAGCRCVLLPVSPT